MAAVDVKVQVQRKGHDLLMTIGSKTTVHPIAEFLRKHYPSATDEQIAEALAVYDGIDKEHDAGAQSE